MLNLPLLYAGVDEAGRGPLAGPVYAAAVILDPDSPIDGLKDSKSLKPLQREKLADCIIKSALGYSIASASVEEIDRLNILQASLLAMQRAIQQITQAIKPELIIIDGKQCPQTSYPIKAIIKADQLVPAVSAASILAKVSRDALMCEYHEIYPEYDFACHKGYPTQRHKALIKQFGLSPIHRKSFKLN